MRTRHGRGGRRVAGAVPLALALAFAGAWVHAGIAGAADDVRVVAIEPARGDSAFACHVLTAGLPDARSRETLASGLPSSLTISLAMLDERGRERASALAEVRIEPDPWERTFVVRGPFGRTRVSSLDELAAELRRLGPFPLPRPPAGAAPREARVRVRLAVHALAPAEADRARALYVGDVAGNGADRREVSAGVGTLLRFFLGRSPASAWRAEGMSPPIEWRAAPRERPRSAP